MTKVIGHRGAPHVARENTVEAFRAAGALGADMVELDVRRTADGALVVHHDAALADGRLIVELAATELPDWVPSLDAALDACAGMAVNIEIKNWAADPDFDPADSIAPRVAELIRRRAAYDATIVSSFNMATIDAVRAADPAVPTAWLTFSGLDATALLDRAVAGGHRALHPHDGTVTAELVTLTHAAGLELNTWTVDDPDRMRELAGWGVDGIVTNVPDVAIAVLRA